MGLVLRSGACNHLLCAVLGEERDAAFPGKISYFLLLYGWIGVTVT